MADLQKTVEIVFGGRNELSSTIGQVEKSLSSINTFSQPFADLATNILKVEAAVLTSLAALGTFSIREAGGFTDGMAEIRTLLKGITDEDFADFTEEIRNLARNMGFSLEDILGATYQSLSQGVPQEAITAFLTSAQTLADAGGATLASAVDLLAGTANAYGQELGNVDGLADIFFDTVENGKTTVEELAASIGRVVGESAPFGVSLQEISAAIATLTTTVSPNTTDAVRILASMIRDLTQPSQQAADAAKELGIYLGADVFKDKTLPELLGEIGEKSGFSAGKIAELFGSSTGLRAALPLIMDSAGSYAENVDKIGEASGSAARAALIMAETYGKANQILINNMRDVLIGIGIPLLDDYKYALGGIIDVMQAVGDQMTKGGAFAPVNEYFAKLLREVGDFAIKVAAALPDALKNIKFDELLKSFDNVKGSLGGILDAILGDVDLTTAEGLGRAIQALVDGFANFNNINAGILAALPIFFSAIVTAAEQISKLSPEQFELIGKGLGAALLLNVSTDGIANVATTIAAFTLTIKALAGINTVALAGVATAMGQFALVLGSGFIGWQAGTEINNIIDSWIKKFSSTGADSLGAQIYDWIHGTGDKSVQKAADDLGAIDLNVMMPTFDTTGALVALKSLEEVARETALETSKIKWELDADGNIAGTVTKITDSIESITKAADPEFDNLKQSFIALGNSPQVAAAMARIELETQRIPKAMEDAVNETDKQSDALILGLAKIDSDLATRVLELKVGLDIAQLEADSKVAVAIIDNIGTTIESTGQLLSDLFGLFVDANIRDKFDIQRQINLENDIRQEAHDMNMSLSQAQIDMMNARTERMKSGDAMITINGDGLAPQLEAFMWEVLKAVQIQAADEESAFLLGI